MGPHELIKCFIPECGNTSYNDVGKKFARVPSLPKLRQQWLKSGLKLKVKVPVVDRSALYCCSDHFDLQYEATKQWLLNDQYNDSCRIIKLKRGVVPHIFPSKQKVVTSLNKPLKKRAITESPDKKYDELSKEVSSVKETIPPKEGVNNETPVKGDQNTVASITDTSDRNKKTVKTPAEKKEYLKGQRKENKRSDNDLPGKTKSKEIVKVNTLDTKVQKGGVKSAENSLKRKSVDEEKVTAPSLTADTPTDVKSPKKRKIVQEILAWIPSDPSVISQLRTSNGMQPFIVVQTPPVSSGGTPMLQLPGMVKSQQSANGTPSTPSVPLRPGKDTQFILTVPDKLQSLPGSNSQLVLAMPQGCSFSIDKLARGVTGTGPGDTDTGVTPGKESNEAADSVLSPESSQQAAKNVKKCVVIPKQDKEIAKTVIVNLLPEESCNSVVSPSTRSPVIKVAVTPSSNSTTPKLSNGNATSDEGDSLSAGLLLVTEEFRELRRTMSNLKKEIQSLKVENHRLIAKNKLLMTKGNVSHNKPLPEEFKRQEVIAEALKSIFTPNQIRMLLGSTCEKAKVRWNETEMDSAYTLSCISPQAYKYVHSTLKYPFPSVSTLKRYIEKQQNDLDKAVLVSSHRGQVSRRVKDDRYRDTLAKALLMEMDSDGDTDSAQEETSSSTPVKVNHRNNLSHQSSYDNEQPLSQQSKLYLLLAADERARFDEEKCLKLAEENRSKKSEEKQMKIDDMKVVRVPVQRQFPTSKNNCIKPNQQKPKTRHFLQGINDNIQNGSATPKIIRVNVQKQNKDPSKQPPRDHVIRHLGLSKKHTEVNKEKQPTIENVLDKKIVKLPVSTSSPSFIQNGEATILNEQTHICQSKEEVSTEVVIDDKDVNLEVTSKPQDKSFSLDESSSPLKHEITIDGTVNEEDESVVEQQPKVVRIQVEPSQLEDGTMIEEVVIHCDDPNMFNDTDVVSLTFQEEQQMEQSINSYL